MTPLWALGLSWALGAGMGAYVCALWAPKRRNPKDESVRPAAAAHGTADAQASSQEQSNPAPRPGQVARLTETLHRAAHHLDALQAIAAPEAPWVSAMPVAPAAPTVHAPTTASVAHGARRLLEALEGSESFAGHALAQSEALRGTLSQVSAAANGVEGKLGQVAPSFNEAALLSTAVSDHLQALHDRSRIAVSRGAAVQSEWAGTFGLLAQFKDSLNAMQDGVNAMHDLASKAKLLSLNAAIVASQAQEHSQGFSVVAEQIKVMAQRASNAAQGMEAGVQAVGVFQSQFAELTAQQAETLSTGGADHVAVQQLTLEAMGTHTALRQLLSQRAQSTTQDDPAVTALKDTTTVLIGELIELGQALRLQDKDQRRAQSLCAALAQDAEGLLNPKDLQSPQGSQAREPALVLCIAWLQRHERQTQMIKALSRALDEAQASAAELGPCEAQARTM